MTIMTIQDKIELFHNILKFDIPQDFMCWLKDNGYFIKPASIHHHGTYEGALFDHSICVTGVLLKYTDNLKLRWERPESPYIVGMFHDLCKLDNYVKTDDEHWEYNNATILPGHGEKSVILLQRFMQLTEEEIYCIRWHMGAFDDKSNWNSYGQAVTHYPNVLYTHTADMYAARIKGI